MTHLISETAEGRRGKVKGLLMPLRIGGPPPNHQRYSLESSAGVGLYPAGLQGLCLPVSRPKKEPRVSGRDIDGLLDGGAYTSVARSWRDTPPCTAHGGQDMMEVFAPRGEERLPVIGELMSGGLISYQGNQQRGTPLTTPLTRTVPSWGLGQVRRKVSHVRRCR